MYNSELFTKKIFEICSAVHTQLKKAAIEEEAATDCYDSCLYILTRQKKQMLQKILDMLLEIAPEDVRDFFLHYEETVQRFNEAIDSYERGEKHGVHA